MIRTLRARWTVGVAVVLLAAAAITLPLIGGSPDASVLSTGVPPAPRPPASVCGNGSILNSQYHYAGKPGVFTTKNAPAGLPTFGRPGSDFPHQQKIVVVAAGNNTSVAESGGYQATGTIFYFEPGRHIVQTVMYTGAGSVYIGGYTQGAGRAVIDGVNGAAAGGVGGRTLSSSTSGVANARQTWEYLTIKNYTASQNNAIMGNENGAEFDSGDIYKFNTIGPNEYGYAGEDSPPRRGESSGGGYAIGLGSDTTIEYNCLTGNAQGAFNGGGANDVISHNEISGNGLGEYPDTTGTGGSPYECGCSGGGKLFMSVNADVTYNYVHNNYNTGIWLDFNNTGADISHNYVAANWGSGISYEASYNANITHNVLVGNGWASAGPWPAGVHGGACYGGVSCTNGGGPSTGAGGGFPYSALDLANSGGNANLRSITVPGCQQNCTVNSRYSGKLLVQDNTLYNNFGGVAIYTDTNRYPGNIDNDSACSVPLGSLNQPNSQTYYQQTEELYTKSDAAISGTSVTTASGTTTLCSNYGGAQGDASQSNVAQAASPGMAVFNLDTGKLIGTVASVTSPNAFRLNSAAPDATGVPLLLAAYGGCGPADYYGGAPGQTSGQPAAHYWDNCIWGSRNVHVTGNTFITQADAVTGCTSHNMCGYMMAAAFNAGVPRLMTFFDKYPDLIADSSAGLGNVWSHNSYYWTGPGQWQFWAGNQGDRVTQGGWTSAPYRQDAGSSFNGSPVKP